MESYVLALDQGTTGSTALLISPSLKVVARATHEFPQIYPGSGMVEHNPLEILESVARAIRSVLQQVGLVHIAAIGITNQRETTVVWDRKTGMPIYNAIVWQCRRTEPLCRSLKEQGLEPLFKAKTGLVLDPYFSGTKVRWILDHVPGARARAEAGELAFGTIDTWLVWNLTGGRVHVTDVSNASRTLLMDLHTLAWDDTLLNHLGVPRALLPEVKSSSEVYGHTAHGAGAFGEVLPEGIPVAGMAGDQQAALFGQLCFDAGSAKCTFGTGAFMLMNTGADVVPSRNGLLTTVAWKLGESVTYALEGSAFIAGAAVQWLRDGLKVIGSASEIEGLARQVPDSGGLVFVPALAGLGAPHWRPEARGVLHGIERSTTIAHMARAVLEGIALQNSDVLKAMEQDLGRPLTQLRVDGGAAANGLLMQFQADVLGVEIVRPRMLETTALGAALLAGLAVGVWPDRQSLASAWAIDQTFIPSMEQGQVQGYLTRWQQGVAKA